MHNDEYIKNFQGFDPDTHPRVTEYSVGNNEGGSEDAPSLLSNEDTRPSVSPNSMYFVPSEDSTEVYEYMTSSWIQKSAAPAGAYFANMYACYNPDGPPFTGRAACEENARRLRADQRTRALENGHPPQWSSVVNYVAGSLVVNHGVVWRCLRENGPDMSEGAREPIGTVGYWIMCHTSSNNVTCYIDYSATVPGTGLVANSPCRSLDEFMRQFRGVVTGKGPYIPSGAGSPDAPSLFVLVKGSGDITETLSYGLRFVNTNIVFALNGPTSWRITAEFMSLSNAEVNFRKQSDGTTDRVYMHIPPIIANNSSFSASHYCEVHIDVPSDSFALRSFCSNITVRHSAILAMAAPATAHVMALYNSFFSQEGGLYINHQGASGTAIDARNSVLSFVGGTTTESTYATSGLTAYMCTTAVVGDSRFNGVWLDGGTFNHISGTMALGNGTGRPQPQHGVRCGGAFVYSGSKGAIVAAPTVPVSKGHIGAYGIVDAPGKAQASWPGTYAWSITDQGVYTQ